MINKRTGSLPFRLNDYFTSADYIVNKTRSSLEQNAGNNYAGVLA